jgi:GTP-binding protein
MDLPDAAAAFEGLRKKFAQEGKELLPISAVAQTNLKTVLWRAHEALKEAPIEEVEPELPVYRAEEDPRGFTIEKEDDLWVVRGKIIERAAAMTFWDQPGSVRRFQRLMTGLGVEKALREAGIQEGDTVSIGDYELEWQD